MATVTARILNRSVRARAFAVPQGVRVVAGQDQRRDLYKPIRVTPEAAQTLAWLTPGNTIDYKIVTNLDWQIE